MEGRSPRRKAQGFTRGADHQALRGGVAVVKYLRRNFDDAAIVAVLAALAVNDDPATLGDKDFAVLAALRRSNFALANTPLPEVQAYLRELGDEQVPGLVSNVKGILHEMEF